MMSVTVKDDGREVRRSSGHANGPAIQVICLGSGGGPSEDNVTGFLVRSTATNWSKNSVIAVDAGSHLAAITRILEKDFPLVSEKKAEWNQPLHSRNGNGHRSNYRDEELMSPCTAPELLSDDESDDETVSPEREPPKTIKILEEGAFAGLAFPHASARANALHIVREHITTYLITHPHIDHISGFVINTAAFQNTSRPKRLAALPFTVDAIKTHIFNNVIWPNLTDEEGGVGLVSFQRLQEGGNIALGEGSGRGFIEVCDGLGVKGFKVSHGNCMCGPGHNHRASNGNIDIQTPQRQNSHAVPFDRDGRQLSFSAVQPGTPGVQPNSSAARRSSAISMPTTCTVDSTAYFIRTESTPTTPKREILIFGDVEPDSLSDTPRTAHIWSEAAPKIAAGILTGIFIEVSYTNAQADKVLFGHLNPRHLLVELSTLADMVRESKKARAARKRKRLENSGGASTTVTADRKKSAPSAARGGIDTPSFTDDEVATDRSRQQTPTLTTMTTHHTAAQSVPTSAAPADNPLKGVKIMVIHVKDTHLDGPVVGDTILRELNEGEEDLKAMGKGLGCVFEISTNGGSYWF